ncbi:Histone acetyltransferase KAT6A [Nymphon striatum]|nr:Histone acetyltransferase KAT6A [Nymphon striatum]
MLDEYRNNTRRSFILEAIHEIKRRKYGLNETRICNVVKHSYGVPANEVRTKLKEFVEENVLILKERDGLKCYKVANQESSENPNFEMESQQQKLSKAILDIIREGKYGVSAFFIQQAVKKHEGLCDATQENVQEAIKMEIKLGTIRERLNGVYCMTSRQAKRRKFDGYYLSDDDEENIEEKSSSKKKKKPINKKTKVSPSIPYGLSQETEDAIKVEKTKLNTCSYCGLDSTDDRKHLVCQTCLSRIHQKCLDYNDKLANRCRQYAWQCMNCKTCTICIDPGNPDNMLFCDVCDKGYHTSCHDPKITDTPLGAWVCSSCEKEDKPTAESSTVDKNENSSASVDLQISNLTQEEISPPNSDLLDDNNNNRNDEIDVFLYDTAVAVMDVSGVFTPESCTRTPKIDKGDVRIRRRIKGVCQKLYEISNVSTWTAQEVTEFFKSLGFVKEAYVFEDQEIDGKTLLLLKRQDILTQLSLKLGPALRIYKHVYHLQMGWSSQKCIAAAVRKSPITQ